MNTTQKRKTITLILNSHKGKDVVEMRFKYDYVLIKEVKKLNGIRWSQTLGSWYLPKEKFNLNKVFEQLKPFAYIDYSDIWKKAGEKPVTEKIKPQPKIKVSIPNAYRDILEQKRYSVNTQKAYIGYFGDFVRFFKNRELSSISKEEINAYIPDLVRQKNISSSQQNQRINAIKFYYEKVLTRKKEFFDIERPRRERKLPNVISEKEVYRIINAHENLKHKCIIAVLYSSGIRMSEMINLRIRDISFDKNIIFVKGGKGKKDRITILSNTIKSLLENYLDLYKPNYWLIEGPNRQQYSSRSVNNIIKSAAKKAGIDKNISAHTLRHSFATHMLEQGIDSMYIQKLLGHNSPLTTAIYTYVSNKSLAKVQSPIDQILSCKNLDNNDL